LKGNAWLEERRDPVKATRGAARYLKRLYEITGDWYLAASSYNAGPLTLERAIQNVGTRNFWDLSRSRWLRTETKNYIPELCAAIIVGRNPERYGLHIVPLVPYVYETVPVSSMTSLTVLARCAGTDTATLKTLNPELLRGSTPPGPYQLRVPPGKAMDCLRQLTRMPAAKRLDFKSYTVRKGDTLAKVARRFKLAPDDLLAANDLTPKEFRPGKRLLVPPPPAIALEERDLTSGKERVKALGDRPLAPLPAMPQDLEGAGEVPLKSESPPQGPTAIPEVPAPAASAEPVVPVTEPSSGGTEVKGLNPIPATAILHAKQGDTLAKLARLHRVPLSDLMRLNPEAAKVLRPGDAVRFPASGAKPRVVTAASIHRVQKGETLATIARKYGVDPGDLKAWNRLKGNRLHKGQRLRLSPR
jgi:membrane-bound lytic murein transglycosylase D